MSCNGVWACGARIRSLCVYLTMGMLIVAAAGCATYSGSFAVIERNLAAQQYDEALEHIEKQSESKTNRALTLLNKGMVLRMKRDFVASNEALEAAKTEMERLYAASVSENALSFVVNDATVSYAGDGYEQVLLHVYMALNYLELGQTDAARVEALQVDVKLRELGEKVADGKFTEDAFSRYLTGLIYEASGEWSDALIAYRKSYEAYKKYQTDFGLAMPTLLKHDLLRLAQRVGLPDEVEQYEKEFGLKRQREQADQSGLGEVVFVLSNGLAPIKHERAVALIDPVSGILARIALPYYESRSNNVVSARITASGKQGATELMEDVDAIARQSLDARMAAITARSLARAVAKITASKTAQQAAMQRKSDDAAIGLLGSFAVQVASVATERADTRSWLTLPANIQLARMRLPAGEYTIKIELLGEGEQVIASSEFSGIMVSKSRKTFLTQHWIPAQISAVQPYADQSSNGRRKK